MAMKPEVPAKAEEQTTALTQFAGYEEYAGAGFQNQTQEDIAIPFLNILQTNSPEIEDESIQGAKAGLLFNSVTQELFTAVEFVPALTQHVFVEWVPRDAGGGLVAQHSLNSDMVKQAKSNSKEFGKYKTPEGNDLVETFYVFGILCNGALPVGMALLAFTSTKIKAYKAIMGRLNSFQLPMPDGRRICPPMFAHLLQITTAKQTNKKGSFYVPVVQPAVKNDVEASLLLPTDPRFLMAAECERLVSSGHAKADMSSQTRGENSTEEDPF